MMLTKTLSLLMVSLFGTACGTTLRATDTEDLSAFSLKMSLHEEWTKIHSKVYATEEEQMKRLKIWIGNHGMSPIVLKLWTQHKFDHRSDFHLGRTCFRRIVVLDELVFRRALEQHKI